MDSKKPADASTKPKAPQALFKPGKELPQQDWKQYKITSLWTAPTQDVQTFETEDMTILIVSDDKIIAYVPSSVRSLLDLFEIVPPKVSGPQTEVLMVAYRKNNDAAPDKQSTMQVYRVTRDAVLECIDKAETSSFDVPYMLGPELATIGFASGHEVGFNLTLKTLMPRNRPDLVPFHDTNGVHVQKMHRLNPDSGYAIGQFEGFYYRFYNLNTHTWTNVGFNLDIDTGYINKALLIGTPADGYLLTSCGHKFLLIKLGTTCSILKTIVAEDITGKKIPSDFFPIINYVRVFKGKYLVTVIDQTNLWIFPLASDAKSTQGKHYDLKIAIDPKQAGQEPPRTDFIKWDTKPGHVILVSNEKFVQKKLDKLEIDFPEFNIAITEKDFDSQSTITLPWTKPEQALKSKTPAKPSQESPSLSEHPYPELVADFLKQNMAHKAEVLEESQHMHSNSGMNLRSTMSKSQHKLTWSAPNPYAQQYVDKPVYAYEAEEAEILASPEYRKKLKVQAAKKEAFQLIGLQHPPKKLYNSLVDHHLGTFLSKTEVRRHLLKQKLVSSNSSR